jgi:hypothetical protein
MSVASLLQIYGTNLDIVYPSQKLETAGYHDVVFWNDTRLIPSPTPTPSLDPPKNDPLPFYASTFFLYVVAASILVAVAVTASALKLRKKQITDNKQ